ncbi:MAG: DUF1415 domain-containing protein [Gemmatimonadota bacterium]
MPGRTAPSIIAATRDWIERAVIGLNLCPFAKAVYAKDLIRYEVSRAETSDELLEDLERELLSLAATPPDAVATTLLIHPWVLTGFLDYNEFLGVAEAAVGKLGLAGVIQVASFHPEYQFAGTKPDEVTNYTNRSPYPMLHLLREAGVDAAIAAFPDTGEIYRRNVETMRSLGVPGLVALGFASPRKRRL